MPVITLNGQTGSGVPEVGHELAPLLSLDYVDQQLLVEAARRIGAPLEAVARRDQRVSTVGERLSRFLQVFLEKSAASGALGDPLMGPTGMEALLSRSYAEVAQPLPSPAQELDDKRYINVIQAVMREAAQAGNVVLIGRGGNFVLRDLPSALHVYLVAPMESRIKVIMRREGMEQAAAIRYIVDTDRNRLAYCRKFFKADVENPGYYHLVVNTGLVPFQAAARVIAEAARSLVQ